MNRPTILIVEDDQEFTHLLKIRLEAKGYRILTTANGDDACELVQTKHPDLVVLDIFLPDMDGLTILKRLKAPVDIETGKPSLTKDIPIIAITGKAPMVENITRVEGASDFFTKPIDMDELAHRINELVEFAHHGRESKT